MEHHPTKNHGWIPLSDELLSSVRSLAHTLRSTQTPVESLGQRIGRVRMRADVDAIPAITHLQDAALAVGVAFEGGEGVVLRFRQTSKAGEISTTSGLQAVVAMEAAMSNATEQGRAFRFTAADQLRP